MDAEPPLSLDDPRLAPYRHFTSSLRYESPGQFIAEGRNVVLRLLASDYACESVLCARKKAADVRPHVRAGTDLFVVPDAFMETLLGFKFHSGVIAVGRRRAWPTIDGLLPPPPAPATVLVVPEITDPLNLGAILRNAAAFGVTAVLLGERCRDPFSRQSVRTSMGTVFTLPVARSGNLVADLARLRDSHAMQWWASVLAGDAEDLRHAVRPTRVGLLVGNEGPGLSPAEIAACDRRVTIPMRRGTDSLNVTAATAVFLYALTTR